ncbi:MAG: TldD/PmbA family protein [Pseudomonadota bacterium]
MPIDSSEAYDLSRLQDRAAQLVEAAQRAGADASDVMVAASRSSGVEVRNGEVEETQSAENNAFALRVFMGQKVASVSANAAGDADELAARAVAMARVSPDDPFSGLAQQEHLAKSFPELDLFDGAAVTFDQMQSLALACEEAALAVPGVTKSSGASFGRSLGGSVLATSDGFIGSYRGSRYSLSVSAVAGDGEAMQTDYDFDSRRHFGDLRNAASIGTLAGERAAKSLNPRQVETQQADIVFEPRMARSLLGHLAGATNGSAIVRKTSFLAGQLNQAIFQDHVNIVDQPDIVRGAGSRPFDAEGVAPSALNLVENGVLNHWLLDSASARELELATNGRANRSGSRTVPGTTNLTLLPGPFETASMIAGVERGIYVTQLIGQGVSLVSGDYSRGVSGFWIENGELTFPVSEVTIAGNLTQMFAALEVGNDLEYTGSVNAPTVVVRGMTIAGT